MGLRLDAMEGMCGCEGLKSEFEPVKLRMGERQRAWAV